jgi:hypothetical protein
MVSSVTPKQDITRSNPEVPPPSSALTTAYYELISLFIMHDVLSGRTKS